MKPFLIRISLALFLVQLCQITIAATPAVQVTFETADKVSYEITHDEGIRKLVFNYEATGVDPGEISMVNIERDYPHCPRSVTITVPKEKVLENGHDIGTLSRLYLVNCESYFHGDERDKWWIFELLPQESYEVGGIEAQGTSTAGPPPVLPADEPFIVDIFEWQFLVLTLWFFFTLYLLWWRLFGPFSRK